MKCPYCDSEDTKVIDKRASDERSFRRRRQCEKCEKRFTTYERVEIVPLTVIKKDGRRENFDRNKMRVGIMHACERRPINQEKIEKIVNEIETEIKNMDTVEIKSKIVGDMAMEKLKELDEVAYIRFASVYKKFRDIESFEKELKELKKG
ncbi:MAG: transcriptional regulator NrdR [Candidatus Aenigmarchaeota archaeon]|nr:transcriptional regulator NrdR [Candidatus Aenigmarchaeota archaeon]